ncbi:MAG: radical SAM protein, partial [Candidatus Latescibacterota bacterium]
RPHVINVSLDTSHVYTFEPSGRLHAAFMRGRHYRRALDNRILESWRVGFRGMGGLRQRWICGDEAVDMLDGIHRQVAMVASHHLSDKQHHAISRIGHWTSDVYLQDVVFFQQVYRPIGILPPDQYLSVVVQATEGCSWNRCRFCDFYQGKSFRIRSLDELDAHVKGVRQFWGDGIGLRRSIFLGDGNALSVSWSAILDMFRCLQSHFPEKGFGPSWRETYAFVDAWGGRRLSIEQIKTLRAMGLKRVYLGLETGHDALLKKVNKRGSAALACDVIRRFKAAGVSVGVIVMLGIGGKAFAQDHVWDTVAVINEMGLGMGDMVYFSPLVVSSHLPYAQDMWAANIEALCDTDLADQYEQLVMGLHFDKVDKPKMAMYNIKRFVY